jgi:hypothetical protein
MAAAINREEAEACSAPGIPAISLDYDDCDVVRVSAPNSLIFTALPPAQFVKDGNILRAEISVMERGC